MITYNWWKEHVNGWSVEPVDYLGCLVLSIITIPLDIVLSPFELIAFIIYKVREGK